ncbi:MAG TPA: diguanylate cyclase [Candidatus Methylomirabilis sp.]|jgi:diguanylate cyclase (GGDEF)-like protein
MWRSFRSSLRFRLLLPFLLSLIPVLVLILYSASLQRRVVAAEVQTNWRTLTRLAAREQERSIAGARQLLALAATLREVRGDARPACSALFADVLKRYPSYLNLGVAGPDGTVFCSAAPSGGPLAAADAAVVEQAVQAGEFVVGDYQVVRIAGKALLLCAYPVVAATGRAEAAVFAVLDLDWLNQLATEAQLPEGATVAVIDGQGTILARHPDPKQWVGRSLPNEPLLRTILTQKAGAAELPGVDRITRLFAFTELPGTPKAVYMAIDIPREGALAAATRIITWSFGGLALVGLLTLAAAWILGDLVVLRRLKALVAAAGRISGGDLSARAPVGEGDEIGAMAQAFNDMAGRLAEMVETEHRAREALAEQVRHLVGEQTREVELLNRMGATLQACQSMDEASRVISGMAAELFVGDAGAVLVLDPARKLLQVAAEWGESPTGEREAFAPEECWALRRGQPHLVGDAGSSLLCRHLPVPPPAVYLCLPLVAHGEALGVLYLAGAAGRTPSAPAITEARQRLADAVAHQLALALANVRLRETLRIQSTRDPVTGLFNRYYMEETLQREVRWGERKHRPVGVVKLGIDRFEQVNDQFGQDAGDTALREVGTLLKSKVRAVDVACRYGGEEFVLILPEVSMEHTRRRAEQLREAAKQHHISHDGKAIGPVTISLGAAGFPQHGSTAEAVLRAAEAALYRAKAAGPDRVMVAP